MEGGGGWREGEGFGNHKMLNKHFILPYYIWLL